MSPLCIPPTASQSECEPWKGGEAQEISCLASWGRDGISARDGASCISKTVHVAQGGICLRCRVAAVQGAPCQTGPHSHRTEYLSERPSPVFRCLICSRWL